MNIITTSLEGIIIIKPRVFKDTRGFFMETYNRHRYTGAGVDIDFVQDNLSYSLQGTVRGLHFQINRPQDKLIQVITGEILDVVVDIRPGSETFGQWESVNLSDHNNHQLFIPKGFAHGFCVLSEFALFAYKCSEFYAPDDEGGILWSDPDIGINWPVENPIVSEKDQNLPCLSDLSRKQLPKVTNA